MPERFKNIALSIFVIFMLIYNRGYIHTYIATLILSYPTQNWLSVFYISRPMPPVHHYQPSMQEKNLMLFTDCDIFMNDMFRY